MKRPLLGVLSVLILVVVGLSSVQAQTPQETLTQYVADLQKNPNDGAMRERIIRHVQTVKPAPAVPSEVVTYEGAAEYAFKNAKSEADYLDAAGEYEKALLAAPWIAADYYNCAVAYEKGGKLKAAAVYFNLYLLAASDAPDATAVRKRIGGLEYAQRKAERVSIQPEVKRDPFEELLKKINGRRYVYRQDEEITVVLDVNGNVLLWGYLDATGYHKANLARITIQGRETTVPFNSHQEWEKVWLVEDTFVISEDGEKITLRGRYSNGSVQSSIYLWQR